MSESSQGPGWWSASDGRWYPPETHADPNYRQHWEAPPPPGSSAATGSSAPSEPPPPPGATGGSPVDATAAAPAATSGKQRTRPLVVLSIVAAIAIVAAVIAVVVLGHGSTASADAVTLEPVGSPGADPFTTAVTVHEVTAFPTDVQKVIGAQPTGTTPEGNNGIVFTGTTTGLYGGTNDLHACDANQLSTFLGANPDKATAWATVEGIQPNDITSFIATLTPVVLTHDTRVTNHGYANGRATSLQSILQAGTAVMIDDTGLPRVKCGCGNPLLAPTSSNATTTNGNPWPGYNPTNVVIVQPGPPATTVELVNITTGQALTQPVGAPPDTTPPPGTTPTTGLQNGTYTLTGTEQCKAGSGPIMSGATLVVDGDHATVQFDQPIPASVTRQGAAFHISSTYTFDANPDGPSQASQLPAGSPQDINFVLDLNGTATDGGTTISGSGTDTGFLCTYTVTGHLNGGPGGTGSTTTAPATSTACPTADQLLKVFQAQSSVPGITFGPPTCWKNWVVTFAATGANGAAVFSTTPTLHMLTDQEAVTFRNEACSDPSAPSVVRQDDVNGC